MSMQYRLPDQVVRADPWTLFCAECSQKMRIHDGHTSPAWEGNTHLRMRLRSQRKDQRGHSLTGSRLSGSFPSFQHVVDISISQGRLVNSFKVRLVTVTCWLDAVCEA
jgi:hypothetical protein